MQFKEILGQEEIKKGLIRTVADQRISHALLFFGPAGSGKLGLAIAFAQYLSCGNRLENDACGTCPSCIKFEKLAHPDLHFIYPVMTTGKITKEPVSDHFIEEWRVSVLNNPYISENQWYEAIGAENKQGIISRSESNNIIRKLGLKSYESEYKTVVIWLPEKMNRSAANSLLKLIEEPPPKTIFLMVSENTGQILPTILSRTQLIRVPPLQGKIIRETLMKRENINPDLVEDALRKANGNYGVVLTMLENDEQELLYFELFTTFMRHCFQRKIIEISDLVDQFAALGRERQKQFISYSLRLVRENFMLNLEKEELSYMSRKEEEFSKKFSSFIHAANVFDIVEELTMAHNHIEANGNPRIIFMDLAVQIIILLKMEPDMA